MSSATMHAIGHEATQAKGWAGAHRFLILRRASQMFFLLLFLAGPWFGLWVVKGTLAGSLTLDTLPLTDPFITVQSFLAGNVPLASALVGAAIVAVVYALIGGRVYCSWVCPINPVTDAAAYFHRRFKLPKGWQPKRSLRIWLMLTVLLVSAAAGTAAWELVNPITMVHRGLLFGAGATWAMILAIFVFDLVVSRRGWCGRVCPVGAFYGLLGSRALLRVSAARRSACNDCMDCFAVCPEMHVIPPALRGKGEDTPLILSPDCTNCGRCIDVCAVNVFQFTNRFNVRTDPVGDSDGLPEIA